MADTESSVSVASPGFGLIDFATLPLGTEQEVVPLTAHDGATSRGVLYTRGDEKTVVCFMHPRADMSRHYGMPALLEAGYATFGQQGRWPNNDVACIHEMLLADIAAGMRFLREERGFEHVVLFGNSGGGSLYGFYQAQAVTPPTGRLTDTPAGDPYDLNELEMPAADGIVHLAVHMGEGDVLTGMIDPSVTDENDPLSCDPNLDMYNPANGFREPPQQSRYSEEFLARYYAAQRARAARLDAIARGYIEEQAHYKTLTQEPGFQSLPPERRTFISRRAVVGRYMRIARTEAHPAYCDLSLHAKSSTREVGSIVSPRPDRVNYMEGGFACLQTPRAWLSTWSGLSSRADLMANLPKLTLPTLAIAYTADNACFPDTIEAMYSASPAQDKTIDYAEAGHFGMPPAGRVQAMQIVSRWLDERFPGR